MIRDLIALCQWNDLEVIRVAGENFISRESATLYALPPALRSLVRFAMKHMLPSWAALCSDIHVAAIKGMASAGERNA